MNTQSALLALALLAAGSASWAQGGSCLSPGHAPGQCLDGEPIPVIRSSSTPGQFAARMIFLADQLERNIDHKSKSAAYLIGTFTNLNNLGEASPLGRLISEALIHELRVRKWTIFEPRLMKDLMITEKGEFALSRDVKLLRENFGVAGIVTGTFLTVDGHMMINARVLDISSGIVLSSGQLQLPATWFTQSLASDAPRPTIKIVGN